MLDLNQINSEISRLEHKDYLTYDICEKLAILYIVRDHIAGTGSTRMETPTTGPTVK